jgi:hypothetical protein
LRGGHQAQPKTPAQQSFLMLEGDVVLKLEREPEQIFKEGQWLAFDAYDRSYGMRLNARRPMALEEADFCPNLKIHFRVSGPRQTRSRPMGTEQSVAVPSRQIK